MYGQNTLYCKGPGVTSFGTNYSSKHKTTTDINLNNCTMRLKLDALGYITAMLPFARLDCLSGAN